jgi:thiol-disulfide isomerase/thioredoxin
MTACAVLGLAIACGGGAERGVSEAPVEDVGGRLGASAFGERDASRSTGAAVVEGEGVGGDRSSARLEVPEPRGGHDRIGRPAPAWGEMEWIGSEPLALEDLRGRVVLIRFWTDTCPFCRATAPALAELDADLRERGVTVIGMYHPKPRGTARSAAEVAEVRAGFGWRFPVALDTGWETLDAFWLATGEREATSASFVLDRRGVIRWVHPGPEFHPGGPADHEECRRDYADVRAALEALLAE